MKTACGDTNIMQAKYDSYNDGGSSTTSGSSGDGEYDNLTLKFTPFTSVQAVPDRVFGSESQYGQSLGINFRDVRIEDGALYVDPDKQKYKLFAWRDVNGMSAEDALERGNELTADDAPEVERKTYAGNDKVYELVAARVPEVTDPSGDVVLESTSKIRDVTFGSDGDISFGEWDNLGGDVVDIGDTISWYNGSDEHGPSAASKTLAEVLTEFGSDAIVDEDDLYNWLPDVSGENILRDDLKDRQVRFFTITRESSNGFTYHAPILEDLSTGAQISPNNVGETESDAMAEAREADSDGTYPEPVADFIQTGKNLNLTQERADKLLDELLQDEDNSLTDGMLDESGGRDNVIEQVI